MSKRVVSLWYQTEGNTYMPLATKEGHEHPLYFYVREDEFVFGNIARDRFYTNDPHTFGNYFEIIKDPGEHFTFYGNKKPVKQLFYYGIEQCLSLFINSVLYKSDSIESYRQNFPIRFIFDSDVEEKERMLIEHIFCEAGYHNVEILNFCEFLFSALSQQKNIGNSTPILLLNGIDNVLYIELYKDGFSNCIGCRSVDGHGADPRVKILADMIIEDVLTRNNYLSLDKDYEIGGLLPYCAGILENITPIISGKAMLSEGRSYYFKVKERVLNERLLYYSNDIIIYSAIADLLSISNIDGNGVIIILGSKEINTDYFSTKLLKKYTTVVGVREKDEHLALQLIFQYVQDNNYKPYKSLPEIDDDDSISTLLFQIETEMANKMELETQLAKLVSDIHALKERKRQLENEKQSLLREISDLGNTGNKSEKKPEKQKPATNDTGDFFGNAKKGEKKSEKKPPKKANDDFDF